jgi:RNA polymerase sigma-70 factor (ECF subfamily)
MTALVSPTFGDGLWGALLQRALCMPVELAHSAPKATTAAAPPFAELYAEYAAFAWRTLRRLGVREADVEDVTQEAFVVVHRKLPEFDGRSSVKTWLFGICLRVASDHRRRAHVRREESVEEVPDSATEPEQGKALEQRQARKVLDQILETLDEDKRTAFVLFELEQWPMADVAEAMGCPLQTAYARLYAARKLVQEAAEARRKEWQV